MKPGIAKREREITDPQQILHILNTARVLHLGMVDDGEPYVIPMNYGHVMENGKLTLYLHSSVTGRKLDVLRKNPKVFFSMECDINTFEGKLPCQYGMVYSSLSGKGTVTIVEDVAEKISAMTYLMKTQTGKDFTFNDRLVSIVSVIRIDVSSYIAKHRPMPERLQKETTPV